MKPVAVLLAVYSLVVIGLAVSDLGDTLNPFTQFLGIKAAVRTQVSVHGNTGRTSGVSYTGYVEGFTFNPIGVAAYLAAGVLVAVVVERRRDAHS